MKKYFLMLVVFAASAANAQHKTHEMQAAHLQNCGGKIYSKCEAADMNQITLFNAAVEEAIAQNKLIQIVFGADWCPPCNKLNDDLKVRPDAVERMDQKYVTVKINVDRSATSGLKLANDLGLYTKMRGIPTLFILDPKSKADLKMFNPLVFAYQAGGEKWIDLYVDTLEQFAKEQGR